MSAAHGKRTVSPWEHKDRGWLRRKAAADARLAVHVYTPGRCKPGCPKRQRVTA